MNRESCQRYLQDPEANASHPSECAECRALAATLESRVEDVRSGQGSLSTMALPLAAWEGATYRSWPLVAAGAVAVAVIAGLLFAATGTSPLELLRGNVPSKDVLASILRLADGGAIQNAPIKWQILIGISFVIVNAIFIALLRRAPRGIDV